MGVDDGSPKNAPRHGAAPAWPWRTPCSIGLQIGRVAGQEDEVAACRLNQRARLARSYAR